MTNLITLAATLEELHAECTTLGLPLSIRNRVEALHDAIPNIERAREQRK